MAPTTACDRCHSIKARCDFGQGRNECERCLRLSHKCETNRVIGKAGRPQTRRTRTSPRVSESSYLDGKPTISSPSITSQGTADVLSEFESQEVRLAQYLVQDQRLDRRFVNSFAVDSFYQETMESSLVRQLLVAPDQVKDALLALSGALIAEEEYPSEQGSATTLENLKRCCSALEKLRVSDSASEDDARAILFVATSLVSVNDLTVGYGYLPIVRAALLATKPWLPQLMLNTSAQFDPHLIPNIFAELMECQRCGEIPTLRWSTPSPQLIDRSYGVAHEVLPYLYDVCLLSHDTSNSISSPATVSDRAVEITTELEQWVPQIQMDVSEDQELYLSPDQQAQMISHGQCYKLLALLLLEQLQARIIDNKVYRAELAQDIRQRVDQFCTINASPQVLYLLYPYFVACTELDDTSEQSSVLAQMKHLSGGIATQACNTMYQFLQFVWASAAVDPTTTWLELVSIGPDFSIGP